MLYQDLALGEETFSLRKGSGRLRLTGPAPARSTGSPAIEEGNGISFLGIGTFPFLFSVFVEQRLLVHEVHPVQGMQGSIIVKEV